MKTKLVCLIVLALSIVNSSLIAGVNEHFNDGVLDPAWQVSLENTNTWSYSESGTNLTISDIGRISGSSDSRVLLSQNFYAAGDFEIKSRMAWNSDGTSASRQTMAVCAYNNDYIVTEGGYCDWWIAGSGGKVARIEYPQYVYDSGISTLPLSGSVDITLKRVNGIINVLWNDQVMLTGFSNTVVNKLVLKFIREDYYPGENFGSFSVDYVSAIPEPASMILLGIGAVLFNRKQR